MSWNIEVGVEEIEFQPKPSTDTEPSPNKPRGPGRGSRRWMARNLVSA
jgi:hypothetical protein